MWRGSDDAGINDGSVWVPPAQLAEHTFDEILRQLLHMQGPYPGCQPDTYGGCFDPYMAKPPFPVGGLVVQSSASASAAATPALHLGFGTAAPPIRPATGGAGDGSPAAKRQAVSKTPYPISAPAASAACPPLVACS